MPATGDTRVQVRRTFLGFWEYRVQRYNPPAFGGWTTTHTGQWYHWTEASATRAGEKYLSERRWHSVRTAA